MRVGVIKRKSTLRRQQVRSETHCMSETIVPLWMDGWSRRRRRRRRLGVDDWVCPLLVVLFVGGNYYERLEAPSKRAEKKVSGRASERASE